MTTKTTLEMRVLQRCIKVLGSERALARELRIPLDDLALWLDGLEKPTRASLLAAVDVLIAHEDTIGLGELHSLAPGVHDPINFDNPVSPGESPQS